MSQPKLLGTPLYALLREDDIAGFNNERPQGPVDMRGGDFRGLDLRELDADAVDFTDAYFRSAALRGIDSRKSSLEGASLAHPRSEARRVGQAWVSTGRSRWSPQHNH